LAGGTGSVRLDWDAWHCKTKGQGMREQAFIPTVYLPLHSPVFGVIVKH
jgi:hypothetical protein